MRLVGTYSTYATILFLPTRDSHHNVGKHSRGSIPRKRIMIATFDDNESSPFDELWQERLDDLDDSDECVEDDYGDDRYE